MVFETLKHPLTLIHPQKHSLFLFRGLSNNWKVCNDGTIPQDPETFGLPSGSLALGNHAAPPSMMDLSALLHYSPMNLRSGQWKWHFFSLRISQPAGDNQTLLDVTKVCLGVFRTYDNIIQVYHAAVSNVALLHMFYQPPSGVGFQG